MTEGRNNVSELEEGISDPMLLQDSESGDILGITFVFKCSCGYPGNISSRTRGHGLTQDVIRDTRLTYECPECGKKYERKYKFKVELLEP